MSDDDFSQIDFNDPEVRRSLARAYAVLLAYPREQQAPLQQTEQESNEPKPGVRPAASKQQQTSAGKNKIEEQ